MLQTPAPDVQSTPPRKRTAADRARKDTHSRACRWAGVTVRTREGKLISEVRADLVKHVGGKPSATQRALIERAVMLTLHLARMDAKMIETGEMSEHTSRVYLSWSNSLRRCLRDLGLQGVPQRPPSLSDLIAEAARARRAEEQVAERAKAAA